VFDATAGLGRDAAVLAVLGCHVLACERHLVIHALLADGLRRAQEDAETAALVGGRLTLMAADAGEVLQAWRTAQATSAADRLRDFAPEVIYLDPMHPPRRSSAKVRKEMQVFQQLVGPDRDQEALLAAARACPVDRVVVKRPVGSPPLAPGVAQRVSGKTTCYDLYLCPREGKAGGTPADA